MERSRRDFLRTVLGGVAVAAAAIPVAADEKPEDPRLPPGATMPKRRLGRTGIDVSVVGLGGAHLGFLHDDQESVRIVREAIDHGVTFLDNCWDYSGGRSEERMGKALRDGYRQRAFLMTKLDGRTAAAANLQLEQSLRRLGTDVIDLVQVHEVIRMTDPKRVFSSGGAIEALVRAKDQGKIRFIGFTGHKSPKIHRAMLDEAKHHGFRFDTVQMPLNVMDPHYDSFEKEVLPLLLHDEIGVLGMKSMGGGVILGSGVVSAPECLRYAMSLPTSVVITGCDSVSVLQQALRSAFTFHPMSRSELDALRAKTQPQGQSGSYEKFKTSEIFDGTTHNPHWLEGARGP
jgi:aryl-alcohol dehydrogenase-like predicted oxidoreductase